MFPTPELKPPCEIFWMSSLRFGRVISISMAVVATCDTWKLHHKNTFQDKKKLDIWCIVSTFFQWRNSPTRALDASLLRFLDHTHLVVLLRKSDQHIGEAATYTTYIKHNRPTSMPSAIRTRNPSNQAAADLRLRPYGHRDRHCYFPRQNYDHNITITTPPNTTLHSNLTSWSIMQTLSYACRYKLKTSSSEMADAG